MAALVMYREGEAHTVSFVGSVLGSRLRRIPQNAHREAQNYEQDHHPNPHRQNLVPLKRVVK